MDADNFVLDAEIVDVVSERAFRARLDNGHELIAYIPAGDFCASCRPAAGARVRVEFSPGDMRRGRIRGGREKEACHESA